MWATDNRPEEFRDKDRMARVSIDAFTKMKEHFFKERERKGLAGEGFVRDSKPKAKKYPEMEDDGDRKLHPARFASLPISEPKDYWDLVPTAKEEIYRHLPLQHFGVENVAEATVVKMHNRRQPVDLEMFVKEVKDIRQAQMAVIQYATIQRYLHPMDMGGMTILIILTEAGWGEAAGDNEKHRVTLVKQFFEDAVRENCSRAARRDPPMSYEQAKARWMRCLTALYPQFGLAVVGQQLAGMGAGQKIAGTAGASKHANNSSSHTRIGTGTGPTSATSGNRQVGPGGPRYTPARYQGLPVCFGFNSAAGCRRLGAGATATTCSDGKTHFAHVCNYFLKAYNAHCLAQHSKIGNH